MIDSKDKRAANAASVVICTADYKHPCDANDGAPCADCAAWLAEVEASARYSWAWMTTQERDPARYEREMRDAGRLP